MGLIGCAPYCGRNQHAVSPEAGDIDAMQSTEREYAARLTRAQLIALNRQGRISNFVPPVNSVILVAMLWGRESLAMLLV